MIKRRGLIVGVVSLLAAPAIIRSAHAIMPVRRPNWTLMSITEHPENALEAIDYHTGEFKTFWPQRKFVDGERVINVPEGRYIVEMPAYNLWRFKGSPICIDGSGPDTYLAVIDTLDHGPEKIRALAREAWARGGRPV